MKKVCNVCGSDNVVKDAWASWDIETQRYVLEDFFDNEFCKDCDGETTIIDVDKDLHLLQSVACFVNLETLASYPQKVNGEPDLENELHLNQHTDEWIHSLKGEDLDTVVSLINSTKNLN